MSLSAKHPNVVATLHCVRLDVSGGARLKQQQLLQQAKVRTGLTLGRQRGRLAARPPTPEPPAAHADSLCAYPT